MSAKVSKHFEKGFELNEEGLRRMHADIRKRIPEDCHNNILIEVFREDSLVYKTSEIDRVLSESNDSTVKIRSITIEYKDNSIDIVLLFDSEDGAELTITGEDRDRVFLIYSDLKEYIQKEVAFLRSRLITNKPVFLLGGPIVIVAGLALAYMTDSTIPSEELKKIIESTDINAKLNFLINDLYKKNSNESHGKYVMVAPVVLTLFLMLPTKKLARYLFPYNTFLIGKQLSIVSNRKSLTNNLFWVVFVGALVSIVTGYYFVWAAK